ncbi:MAG: type II toxin-antitoxin system RelE/ParE family toxin [Gammaproteobacteria bacterium]|nr:type II toxin-antitoxin system RelE/ParE family toxin [Gammaproteobacteria bacterium]
MKALPAVLRSLAASDVEQAVDFYVSESSAETALGFVDALEHSFAYLGRHPASGSHRYAHELQLPALRSWPLRRYPYVVFYVQSAACVDVWRVLHAERDLPARLRDEPP